MAVVDKKPETSTAQPMKLGLASLVGVVFIVGSLAVAFKAVPALLAALGLTGDAFGGSILTGLGGFAVLLVLAIAGYRMIGGAHSRPGLRAGIFLGFVFVFVWAAISRWIGGLIEGWTYSGDWFSGNEAAIGGGITAVLSGLLGFWMLRIFLRPTMENRFLRFEEAGWFSATTYKQGQGTRVRRGTILGFLLMTGGGIFVLMNHGTLERGTADWEMNIPFTGFIVVDDLGDAEYAIKEGNLPSEGVRVLSTGDTEGKLPENATVSRETALAAIEPLAKEKLGKLEKLLAELRNREKALAGRRDALGNQQEKVPYDDEIARIQTWTERLGEFAKDLENPDRLFLVQREIDKFKTSEEERERERKRADKKAAERKSLEEEFGWIVAWAGNPKLPVVAQVFSRFAYRNINKDLDPLLYRVVKDEDRFARLPKAYQFKKGEIIERNKFDAAVELLKPQKPVNAGQSELADWENQKRKAETDAKKAAPEAKPMRGTPQYAHLTLMPSVKFTLPLVLLLGAVWLAWRIANMPAFADFLIATESELNKVSWTTRQRLVQDTIVVLVTMVLMAVFLFVVDIAWARLLSSKPIGVLRATDPTVTETKEKDLKW